MVLDAISLSVTVQQYAWKHYREYSVDSETPVTQTVDRWYGAHRVSVDSLGGSGTLSVRWWFIGGWCHMLFSIDIVI